MGADGKGERQQQHIELGAKEELRMEYMQKEKRGQEAHELCSGTAFIECRGLCAWDIQQGVMPREAV